MVEIFEKEEHLKHIEGIFKSIELKLWGNGFKKGIDYPSFRDLLKNEMGLEFDTTEEFSHICQELDASGTNLIQF
jgi:hypothetical protein